MIQSNLQKVHESNENEQPQDMMNENYKDDEQPNMTKSGS